MQIFSPTGHERVTIVADRESGLRAIIALHSTVLGPGLGGTRFFPYPTEQAAFDDALRLSRAMTYKNAVAGLDAGGGKGVIFGDPTRDKTPELLRAYGRAVAALQGRYVTACDVGTYVSDMDVVAETNPWTTGRSRALGGAGDSGELTALGVFEGMRAAAEARWGEPTLEGRRVAITGLGKVGRRLAAHLLADGAEVIGADTSAGAVGQVLEEVPGVTITSPDVIAGLE
jgi:valine dehydrogenase (NAD+)